MKKIDRRLQVSSWPLNVGFGLSRTTAPGGGFNRSQQALLLSAFAKPRQAARGQERSLVLGARIVDNPTMEHLSEPVILGIVLDEEHTGLPA
ncbi:MULTISPECIES: hypothetical protein [unclassified Burkholderia]|uniref:hypothetical protein n=1 Tax=unclassified Burkholderia TaxID=2613784 RepID=UPI00158DE0C0|nr:MULTISPECIES: hypothetical protein [unclassified Burkholderia]